MNDWRLKNPLDKPTTLKLQAFPRKSPILRRAKGIKRKGRRAASSQRKANNNSRRKGKKEVRRRWT